MSDTADPLDRTPNGAADLLDDEEANKGTGFTIDGEAEEDIEVPPAQSVPTTSDGSTPEEKEDHDDKSAKTTSSGGSSSKSGRRAREAKLAKRTNQIMSDYQAYLAEIETEFPDNQDEEATDQANKYIEEVRGAYRDAYRDKDESNGVDTATDVVSAGGGLVRGWSYKGDLNDVTMEMIEESGMVARGQKYTHPILHSKKFKRCVLAFALVCAAAGAVAGVIGAKKNKDVSNLEKQISTVAEEEGKKKQASSMGATSPDISIAYETAAETFMPLWHDRSQGWNGQTYEDAIEFCSKIDDHSVCPFEAICPLGPGAFPLGGTKNEPEGSWAPVIDSENSWVEVSFEHPCVRYEDLNSDPRPAWGKTGKDNESITRHVACCRTTSQYSGEEFEIIYEHAAEEYHPVWMDRSKGWKGQTYDQAEEFCEKQPDYTICPYEVICPRGPSHAPLGGYKDGPSGSWTPVRGAQVDWVQVSSKNTCEKYYTTNDLPPEWAVAANKDEDDVTGHLMCCLKDPVSLGTVKDSPKSDQLSEEDQSKYKEAVLAHKPKWYDRSKYDGSAYLEAQNFCKAQDSRVLCPFEAVCPLGPNTIPVGGLKNEPNGSWVPIDEANEWVQVSRGGECQRYASQNGKQPDWGLTGEREDITRHLVCCVEESSLDHLIEPDNATATNPHEKLTAEEQEKYKDVVLYLEPKWYDRSDGWNGQAYLEASEFCSTQDSRVLCPYTALCPLGVGRIPTGGLKKGGEDGIWIPISTIANDWVQVGRKRTCELYSSVYGDKPDWGLTGQGHENVTEYVACCVEPPSETTDSTGDEAKSTSSTTSSTTTFSTTTSTTTTSTTTTTPATTKTTTTVKATSIAENPTFQDEKVYEEIAKSLQPIPYDRQKGWTGTTYAQALQFCAAKDSRIPCPYIAYCPKGAGNEPLGTIKNEPSGAWAPIMDASNAWVSISNDHTCQMYSSVYGSPPVWGLTGEDNGISSEQYTRHIMCCLEHPGSDPGANEEVAVEPEGVSFGSSTSDSDESTSYELSTFEQDVLNVWHPIWFDREDGYQGTTYDDAAEFCKNVGGMHLCSKEAYCPHESTEEDLPPLFLGTEAFDRQQWAPIADEPNSWVLVGTLFNDPKSTCQTYKQFHGRSPKWGVDGSSPEFKEHILCCVDPSYSSIEASSAELDSEKYVDPLATMENAPSGEFDLETVVGNELKPKWFEWTGGSHDDAVEFCSKDGQSLCPYPAYCPHGPGQPPMEGHKVAFRGVQWAPVAGHENHWVMIGRKAGNSATTCLNYEELEGGSPSWGLTAELPQIKKFILCCTFSMT